MDVVVEEAEGYVLNSDQGAMVTTERLDMSKDPVLTPSSLWAKLSLERSKARPATQATIRRRPDNVSV